MMDKLPTIPSERARLPLMTSITAVVMTQSSASIWLKLLL